MPASENYEGVVSEPLELEAIERRHVLEDGFDRCKDCRWRWPCSTIRLVARVRELEAALPDADKLIALAKWLNLKFPDDSDPEVQQDLVRWGLSARAALEGVSE